MNSTQLETSNPLASLWCEQLKQPRAFKFQFAELDRAGRANHVPAIGDEAPAVADSILAQAFGVKASDLHLEPTERSLAIRQRRDGVLETISTLDHDLGKAVVSCLKIRSGLDIAEKRRPQDGRMTYSHGAKAVDIRVSTMPTQFGEKVVLRLLDSASGLAQLEQLGLLEHDRLRIEKALAIPEGLFLLTGPTGSGKTTTLYAMLRYLSSPELNIQTIEDPIEYRLAGINQSQVKPEINYTFANALRSFLRQDPDILMVGEIRDRETLSIAIQAALTGHRVLSTLHTNDAPSAVVRLVDLGAEPFLLAATLKLVVAQRLVRRACSCRGFEVSEPCPACAGSGLSGRVGLFEGMTVDGQMAKVISRGAELGELRDLAVSAGMRTLRNDGEEKCAMGWTTRAEVERVVQ